jgi:hypothetical protein
MSLKDELIKLGSTHRELRPHLREILSALKEGSRLGNDPQLQAMHKRLIEDLQGGFSEFLSDAKDLAGQADDTYNPAHKDFYMSQAQEARDYAAKLQKAIRVVRGMDERFIDPRRVEGVVRRTLWLDIQEGLVFARKDANRAKQNGIEFLDAYLQFYGL